MALIPIVGENQTPRSRSVTTTNLVRSRSVPTTLVRSRTVTNDLPGYDSEIGSSQQHGVGYKYECQLNLLLGKWIICIRHLGEGIRTKWGFQEEGAIAGGNCCD
ncbi:hypothetical protein WN943_007848 [Citrus x changshan-huyou]